MNRYNIALFLILLITAAQAQSGLRKAGIYEVGDTTIEVYDWKEPFAIREFKTINGTDIILFREFNALTKKVKQEGTFKGGYSTGTWKFYGWTGRLKKEINYDYMVKTFYVKKNDQNIVDFDFEKYKEDSLFVYNYWKHKKRNDAAIVANSKPVAVESATQKTVTADSLQNKQSDVGTKESGLFKWRRNKKNEQQEEEATTLKLTSKTADSPGNTQSVVVAKEETKLAKEHSNAIPKPAAAKKTEPAKETVAAPKEKQLVVVAKEAAKPVKEEHPNTPPKPADTKRPEPAKEAVTTPKEKQPVVVAKEAAKPVKEELLNTPAKPADTKRPESAKVAVTAPKEKQHAVVAKEVTEPVKEEHPNTAAKPADTKRPEPAKEAVAAPKEKQPAIVAKEPAKPKTTKEISFNSKVEPDGKNKQATNENTTAKNADIKEVNTTNSKANELLLEEYSRLKKESMPNPVEKVSQPASSPVRTGENTTSEGKQQQSSKETSLSQTKQKTDLNASDVKSKKEISTSNDAKSSNVKNNEKNKNAVDSLKQKVDSLQVNKTIQTAKATTDSTQKAAIKKGNPHPIKK